MPMCRREQHQSEDVDISDFAHAWCEHLVRRSVSGAQAVRDEPKAMTLAEFVERNECKLVSQSTRHVPADFLEEALAAIGLERVWRYRCQRAAKDIYDATEHRHGDARRPY